MYMAGGDVAAPLWRARLLDLSCACGPPPGAGRAGRRAWRGETATWNNNSKYYYNNTIHYQSKFHDWNTKSEISVQLPSNGYLHCIDAWEQ